MGTTLRSRDRQKRDPNGGGSAARSRSRSSSSTAIRWIPLRCTVFHRTGGSLVVRDQNQNQCAIALCELRPVQCDHEIGDFRQQFKPVRTKSSTESSSLLNSLSTCFDGVFGETDRGSVHLVRCARRPLGESERAEHCVIMNRASLCSTASKRWARKDRV